MLFLAYIAENTIVHSVDALIIGGGYWLVRFARKGQEVRLGIGMVLIVLYLVATAGTAMAGGPGISQWGVGMAVVGALIAEAIGRLRSRPRVKTD